MIGIVLDAPALIAMLKGKTGAVIGHRYCSEITRCAQLAFATSKGICLLAPDSKPCSKSYAGETLPRNRLTIFSVVHARPGAPSPLT
jgi:hypothetical protein